MILKTGVIFNAQAPLLYALWKAQVILGKYGEVVVTSVRDGQHSEMSLHYRGLAADLRSKHLTQEQRHTALILLKRELGADYDVLLESEGKPNEHFHIEFDPKEKRL